MFEYIFNKKTSFEIKYLYDFFLFPKSKTEHFLGVIFSIDVTMIDKMFWFYCK